MTAQRTYGGISAAERRAGRRAALLDAALEIIGTQGVDKLTVAGLCAQAGLNERYYYEQFTGRDAVLTALFDGIAEELAHAIVQALQQAGGSAAEASDHSPDASTRRTQRDTRTMAHAAVAAGIHVLTDDPRKAQVALAVSASTPELRSRTLQSIASFANLVAVQGIDFYGMSSPTPDPAIGFRATYLVGGLVQTLTSWLQGDIDMSREQLIDETTDVFVLLGEDLAGRLR
ncbi:TetR/AcrR family transcriptional regulator [Nocardia mikamii]|uniref:TetR/AcrR family transcriptional regulator n=1 Tax=Nocardia mikamii TaxID=508464 RepID=UPI001FE0EB05|nr:TetR/AcrR family transcriptional regulator [Nocardia mikamii]